jgi:hypothetical protein
MHQKLLEIVTRQFELQVVEQESLLVVPQFVQADQRLKPLVGRIDLIYPHTNERTRAEMIVAPLLIHLAVSYRLSLYSGTAFNADVNNGLSGTVDHLFSRAQPQQSVIGAPITAVVETKSEYRGVSHCLVQMIAAQRFNSDSGCIYGVVTTGLDWRFLKLEARTVTIDLTVYPFCPIESLLSLLAPMVS